jgi:hypothetical protein
VIVGVLDRQVFRSFLGDAGLVGRYFWQITHTVPNNNLLLAP